MTEKKKELSFTGINYSVCTYCKYRIASKDDGQDDGCFKRFVPGKGYARLAWGDEGLKYCEERNIDCVDELHGCNQFESSGLPIHPQVLERIVGNNPLLKTVPVDEKATETSWDLERKAERFMLLEISSIGGWNIQ